MITLRDLLSKFKPIANYAKEVADDFNVGLTQIDVGDGATLRDMLKEFDIRKPGSAPVKVLSKEGLASVGGAREALKGVGRFGLRAADLGLKVQPPYWIDPRFRRQQQKIFTGLKERLKPRGTDVQRAIGGGFELGAEFASYGPVEAGLVGGVSKFAPKLVSKPLGGFLTRRAADVASGQLLVDPEVARETTGGRLGMAAMDVLGGTLAEGVGTATRPLVGISAEKVNLFKAAQTHNAPIPDRVRLPNGGITYQTGYKTIKVPNEQAEAFFKTGKWQEGIKIKDYKTKGVTDITFDPQGNVASWNSDNPKFISKIKQQAPSIGMTTADVTPKGVKKPKATSPITGKIKQSKFASRIKASKNVPKEIKDSLKGDYYQLDTKAQRRIAKEFVNKDPKLAKEIAKSDSFLDEFDVRVSNAYQDKLITEGKIAEAGDIAVNIEEKATTGGRIVQALSDIDFESPTGVMKYVKRTIKNYNEANPGKKIKLDKEVEKALIEKARKIYAMEDGAKKAKLIDELSDDLSKIVPSDIYKKGISLWKTGFLTSPKRVIRDFISNYTSLYSETLKDIPASFADRIMAVRTGARSKAFTIDGLFGKGLKDTEGTYYKTFDPMRDIARYDMTKTNFGSSKLGKAAQWYTNAIMKTIKAADRPVYKRAFARSLYDQANAAAINAGRGGDKAFIKSFIKEPSEEAIRIATKDASYTVFQDSTLGAEVIQGIKNAARERNMEFAVDVFMPFSRTPSSIAQRVISYSPVNLGRGTINIAKQMIDPTLGLQREVAEQFGRGIVGTTGLATGYLMFANGMISGSYPDSERERKQWELEGKKPYSILIDGRWYGLDDISPQLSTIIVGATIAEALLSGDPKKALKILDPILDQPLITGAEESLELFTKPGAIGRFGQNKVASIVPVIISDVARGLDPLERKAEGYIEKAQSRIPVWRQGLKAKTDVLGQEIPGAGFLPQMFDPARSKKVRGDEVVSELGRVGATPTKLEKEFTIAGQEFELDREQLKELADRSGKEIKSSIEKIINIPDYKKLDDESKKKVLDNVVSNIRSESKKRFVSGEGFDINADVRKEIKKQELKDSDKKILIDGDIVYKKSSDDNIRTMSKLDYDIDLDEAEKTNLKTKKNYKKWLQNATELMQKYERKWNTDLTDEERIELETKILKLHNEMNKYSSYGGSFTKPKKAKALTKLPKSAVSLTPFKSFKVSKPSKQITIKKPTVSVRGLAEELARGER